MAQWLVTSDGKLVQAGGSALRLGPVTIPPTEPPEEPEIPGPPYATPPFPADNNPHTDSTALDSEKFDDHSAMLALVPASQHTVFAGADGDWSNPLVWSTGAVPGAGAKVWIPSGRTIRYDLDSTAALAWVRNNGTCNWATDASTTLVTSLFVNDGSGTVTMGTRTAPIPQGVTADVLFPDTQNISVAADPNLLGRGFISHGDFEGFGAEKTVWDFVASDPMSGNTTVTLASAPTNWQVGDVIVIAGTRYSGWSLFVLSPPEDEIRRIKSIVGATITLGSVADETVTQALVYDHDSPRSDLKTVVANYTRNITFASQSLHGVYGVQDYFGYVGGTLTVPVHRRGHVMFMHSHHADVRFAAFHELGRTRKGRLPNTDRDTVVLDNTEIVDHTTNIRGRYPLHFHRTGHGHIETPGIAYGCAVWGTAGWGVVHHDGNANLQNNCTFNTIGAGFVAETGNEVGTWNGNFACNCRGESSNSGGWIDPKPHHDSGNTDGSGRKLTYGTFDLARTGDGFWFQGREIHVRNNVAASVNDGFAYFHRGRSEDRGDAQPGMISYRGAPDSEELDIGDMVLFANGSVDEIPIRHFRDNEAFACRSAFFIEKAGQRQRHDFFTHLKGFKGWRCRQDGAHFSYTGHYLIEDFDLIGNGGWLGIKVGTNAVDMIIRDATIDNFGTGIRFTRNLTSGFVGDPSAGQGFVVIDGTYTNVNTDVANADDVISSASLSPGTMTVVLDSAEPLTYQNGSNYTTGIPIVGDKTDSIGQVAIAIGTLDSYYRTTTYLRALALHDGVYDDGGTKLGVLPMYWSDRATGRLTKKGYVFQYPAAVSNWTTTDLGTWNASPGTPSSTGASGSTGVLSVTDAIDAQDVTISVGSDFSSCEQPKHGRVFWMPGDSSIVYRPDIGWSGTDTFDGWRRDQQNFTRFSITVTVS